MKLRAARVLRYRHRRRRLSPRASRLRTSPRAASDAHAPELLDDPHRAGGRASRAERSSRARTTPPPTGTTRPASRWRRSRRSAAARARYQSFSLIPEDLSSDDSGGSSQQVPALVGVVVKNLFGDKRLTGGFSVVRTNSFEQETDAQIDGSASSPAACSTTRRTPQYRRTEASLGLGYSCDRALAFRSDARRREHEPARASESIFDQEIQSDGLDAGLAARRASGSITQLRASAGASSTS